MNVLVTGGAGYVGSHATRHLARAGHAVWILDNLSRGHREAALPGRLIEGDIGDKPLVQSVLREKQIEAVIHFAAYALVAESVSCPDIYFENNISKTLCLFDAMRLENVSRIVFSSSTATYGAPRRMPIVEDTTQEPINPYGFTKLAIERVLRDFEIAFGWKYAALRYFNAAGASPSGDLGEDHEPESHLIPIVLQVALGKRKSIAVYGDDYSTDDGTCVRDYVHVDDLGDAHTRALDYLVQEGKSLEVNLGTGAGTSVRQIIDACRDVTGHPIPEKIDVRRPGDPPALVANPSRARKLLNWSPQYRDIHQIVETAWRWHKSHPDGYSS